jgi:hypothetical protein
MQRRIRSGGHDRETPHTQGNHRALDISAPNIKRKLARLRLGPAGCIEGGSGRRFMMALTSSLGDWK